MKKSTKQILIEAAIKKEKDKKNKLFIAYALQILFSTCIYSIIFDEKLVQDSTKLIVAGLTVLLLFTNAAIVQLEKK